MEQRTVAIHSKRCTFVYKFRSIRQRFEKKAELRQKERIFNDKTMHNVIDLILTDIVWLFVRRLNLQKENDLNRKERTFLDAIVPYLDVYTHTHTKCVVSMNKYCLRKLQRKISDYYECI